MNRMMTSFFSLALVGLSSVLGCGSDVDNGDPSGSGGSGGGGSGGSGGGGTISIDEIGKKTAELFCGTVFSCCTAAELPEVFASMDPPQTEEECIPAYQTLFEMVILPDQKAAIEAGRLTYDGAKAAACFAKVNSNCALLDADLLGGDPDCQAVFVGLVADGGDCGGDDECAGAGSSCVGMMSMQLGKCQPPGAVGAACNWDEHCQSNYCDFSAGTCAEMKAIGEMCSFGGCKDSYCDSMTSVCTAKRADGEACDDDDQCTGGSCDEGTMTCATAAPFCDGM